MRHQVLLKLVKCDIRCCLISRGRLAVKETSSGETSAPSLTLCLSVKDA